MWAQVRTTVSLLSSRSCIGAFRAIPLEQRFMGIARNVAASPLQLEEDTGPRDEPAGRAERARRTIDVSLAHL